MASHRPNVAVIGAGIIGAACAVELQKAGLSVVLLDRQLPGHACSFGNAGLIADDHLVPLCRPSVLRSLPRMLLDADGPLRLRLMGLPGMLPWLLRFAWAARPASLASGTVAMSDLLPGASAAFKAMLVDAGLRDLILEQGSLLVCESVDGLRQIQRDEGVLSRYGVEYESLSADEARARLGGLAGAVAGGRYYPRMRAVSDPYAVVEGLVRHFSATGGVVLQKNVLSLVQDTGHGVGIRTDDGVFHVDKIVMAAGTASARLLTPLGVNIPLTAERGYHVMLEGGPHLTCPLTFQERGFVATPMLAGTRVAGTVELGGGKPNWARADLLAGHMRQLFPSEPISVSQRWSGDRPTTPDYLPVIGPLLHHPRVLTAFGHQHLGLTLSATTAVLIRLLVQQRDFPHSIRPFRPERFAFSGFHKFRG